MDAVELIDDVMRTAGLATREEAERALRATVAALATSLSAPARAAWLPKLPPALRAVVTGVAPGHARSARELYAQVPAIERVPAPFAMEHAQSAVRVLGRALDVNTRARLGRELPREIADLLQVPDPSSGALPSHAPVPAQHPAGSTLASGAPGSRNPVSEARPRAGQSGSVAEWEETRVDHTIAAGHEDNILASGRPDSDADTLATGRPGSRGLSH